MYNVYLVSMLMDYSILKGIMIKREVVTSVNM